MKKILVLLQQDLRLSDNPALYHAAREGEVVPVYILDDAIPEAVALGGASRWWLHHSLKALETSLKPHNIHLTLRRGKWVESVLKLVHDCSASAVYWNRCYEPHAIARNKKLKIALEQNNIETRSFNGSLLFEPWDIVNKQGQYFKVFTPFWNHCLRRGGIEEVCAIPRFSASSNRLHSDTLESWKLLPHHPDWAEGLKDTWQPGEKSAHKTLADFVAHRLDDYPEGRDFPAQSNTSCLSPHLHWGEISPRQVWHAAKEYELHGGAARSSEKFLSELGWREFSYYLLYHFPALPEKPFNEKFSKFPWAVSARDLDAWQRGQTGYPIVDAGMRELWRTGYMHNRVRMIAASFLTKDLRIAWQEGAAWFLDTLVDADLANNSASWQWVAGCGADAAPYYRIFNPELQGKKFDPEGEYVRRWIPELGHLPGKYIHRPEEAPEQTLREAGVTLGKTYPKPMVDHSVARETALGSYKKTQSA